MTSDTILTTLKNWVQEQFDQHDLWTQSAEDISADLVSRAIQAMQRDLGDAVLESLDWDEFNQILFQYLFEHPSHTIKQILQPLEEFYAQTLAQRIIKELDLENQPISLLKRRLGLSTAASNVSPVLIGQSLSHAGPIPEIASELPMLMWESKDNNVDFSDQFQADLWASDAREVAYLRYHSKHNRHQYLEHYITSARDANILPWESVGQILSKFGLTAAKLHLILSAYAAKQPDWSHPFTLTVDEVIKDLGWSSAAGSSSVGSSSSGVDDDLRTKVTNILYALSCVLVKLVWVGNQGDRSTKGQTPVGKLWDLLITPGGNFDWQTGQIESADTIRMTVRPGLWLFGLFAQAQDYLTSEYGQSSFLQFGRVAHQLLQLGAYNHDLTVRTVIYLMLETQLRVGETNPHQYQVRALLEQVIPETLLNHAQSHIKQGQQLFEDWNYTLQILAQLNWHLEIDTPTLGDRTPNHSSSNPTAFYMHPYPKWLHPDSTTRKPRGWVQTWLGQTLQVYPGAPFPISH